MLIRPVELAEYEKEKSEILCGFSISIINLVNGCILLMTSFINCSALGWWMVNYFSITGRVRFIFDFYLLVSKK